IVVRCYDGRTKFLLETVQDAVEYYRTHGGEDIPVMAINDDVAKLYMLSQRGKREFPEYNDVVRYCISLARMLQCPISEYAALEDKIASIVYNPLQKLLPREKLLECLHRAFINIVNEIGVSINDVIHTHNKLDLLQYVSGLGPRKAEVLVKKILSESNLELERREEMQTNGSMGNKVFTNCAGFIRVRPKRVGSFDDTRIHPTYYILARKMVCDALDLEDDEAEEELYHTNNRR
ncbi:15188_t:CDS:2, partial [Acaulospora morrowiae]